MGNLLDLNRDKYQQQEKPKPEQPNPDDDSRLLALLDKMILVAGVIAVMAAFGAWKMLEVGYWIGIEIWK